MKPKRTILCVDDNEQSLSIRKVLLETRGYRVLAIRRVRKPWNASRRAALTFFSTDLNMPGLDGAKLIQAAKNISPQTPAILLSGKNRLYDHSSQADVFLRKHVCAGRSAGAHSVAADPQARSQAG